MQFKKGDVVMLKSGGPKMTVIEIGEEITCTWFGDRNAEPFYRTFDPTALVKVE